MPCFLFYWTFASAKDKIKKIADFKIIRRKLKLFRGESF